MDAAGERHRDATIRDDGLRSARVSLERSQDGVGKLSGGVAWGRLGLIRLVPRRI